MHAHNKLHAVHYERKRLMSARLEWLTAAETTPDLLRRGDEASDHTEVTGPFAMVLGHPDGAIIEGSLPELRAMFVRAAELLDIAELLQLLEPTHRY